jgi:2-hydroxychromene-2-carboxylate isomerase
MTRTIAFYFDFPSPYAYLARRVSTVNGSSSARAPMP